MSESGRLYCEFTLYLALLPCYVGANITTTLESNFSALLYVYSLNKLKGSKLPFLLSQCDVQMKFLIHNSLYEC